MLGRETQGGLGRGFCLVGSGREAGRQEDFGEEGVGGRGGGGQAVHSVLT